MSQHEHQQAFDEAKTLASSTKYLAYYDVNVPVVLQVDATDYGLGALLQLSKLHPDDTLDDSSLQPVAYGSKSLTSTKQWCPQIEKSLQQIPPMATW